MKPAFIKGIALISFSKIRKKIMYYFMLAIDEDTTVEDFFL